MTQIINSSPTSLTPYVVPSGHLFYGTANGQITGTGSLSIITTGGSNPVYIVYATAGANIWCTNPGATTLIGPEFTTITVGDI